MVNEEKALIMTKIARDEIELGQKVINEGSYYKNDYIRSHMLSVMLHYSIAYVLILILIALYNVDYILLNFVALNYVALFFEIFLPYIFIMMLCAVISFVYFSDKYHKNRVKIKKYFTKLKRLEKYYADSRKETMDDKITGA